MPGDGRRLMVIYNPTAGWRRRRRFNAVLRALAAAGCPLTVRETAGHGEAERLARAAMGEACDVVVSAGGDGTLNEIANAVAGSGTPVGIVPLGTANVMAAEIGLGKAPEAVADVIAHGHPRPVHLGRLDGRLFCAMAGIGLDARIVAGVNPGLKRRLGKGAYAWGVLKELMRLSPIEYSLTVHGEPRRAAWAIAANAHFYAGRFVSAPGARIDLPTLHLVLLERTGRWNLLRYGVGLALGTLHELEDVHVVPTRAFTIDAPEGAPVQADGDLAGRLPMAVSVAEERLDLLMPG